MSLASDLLQLLGDNPKGCSARYCADVLLRDISERGLRKIRRLVARCEPYVVSWPGSAGYRCLRYCTQAEIDHALAALRHQAFEMNARALEIEQAYARWVQPELDLSITGCTEIVITKA